MKNLKNLLVMLMALTVLSGISSCKKSNNNPDSQSEDLDMTKYCIVGKQSFNDAPDLPFILTFEANGKASYIRAKENIPIVYTFSQGVLTIDFGSGKESFKISNGAITSYDGPAGQIKHSLVKIPETNQLSGNTYSGVWKTKAGPSQLSNTIKFNGLQYGEVVVGQPVVNKGYTLIKNIAAAKDTSGVSSFWVLMDGKLEASKSNATSTIAGTFNKQ